VVSNGANAGATSGTVTVTETVPTGLTLVSMTGTGWLCAATSCSRTDSLAAGGTYPAITVTVNVTSVASSPQINTVTVTGGGSPSASATDSTAIIARPPVLVVTKTHVANFTVGQHGATYVVTVSNVADAGPTTGPVTVTETVPSGLTLVSMNGVGWQCIVHSCVRDDVLSPGASYPAIGHSQRVDQCGVPAVNVERLRRQVGNCHRYGSHGDCPNAYDLCSKAERA
jgi:uncharacterized repeat protein (TIGR01451 family)